MDMQQKSSFLEEITTILFQIDRKSLHIDQSIYIYIYTRIIYTYNTHTSTTRTFIHITSPTIYIFIFKQRSIYCTLYQPLTQQTIK